MLVDVAGFYVSYFRDDEPVWTSRVSSAATNARRPSSARPSRTSCSIRRGPSRPASWSRTSCRSCSGTRARSSACTSACSTAAAARSIRTRSTGTGTGRRGCPLPVPPGSGSRQCTRPRQDHVPEPVPRVPARSPAKSLYDQDQRTFSSGCIRVQQPFELTELVLNDPQWNQQTIKALIDRRKHAR